MDDYEDNTNESLLKALICRFCGSEVDYFRNDELQECIQDAIISAYNDLFDVYSADQVKKSVGASVLICPDCLFGRSQA